MLLGVDGKIALEYRVEHVAGVGAAAVAVDGEPHLVHIGNVGDLLALVEQRLLLCFFVIGNNALDVAAGADEVGRFVLTEGVHRLRDDGGGVDFAGVQLGAVGIQSLVDFIVGVADDRLGGVGLVVAAVHIHQRRARDGDGKHQQAEPFKIAKQVKLLHFSSSSFSLVSEPVRTEQGRTPIPRPPSLLPSAPG